MMKPANKVKTKPIATAESDSDSPANDSSADEEFISDAEYPMSENGSAGESDEEMADRTEGNDELGEPTKWAKTMAKFLRKPNDGKILSKAPSEKEHRKTKQTHKFEIVSEEGISKKEVASNKQEDKPDDLKLGLELLRQKKYQRKEWHKDILGLRVRPSIHDYERERTLRKVATKGTVQLFNAVRKQQNVVGKKLDEAGKLEYKREKVLKNLSKKEFLNALMNGPRAKSELVDNLVKEEADEDELKSEVDSDEEPKSTWGALRADFLTGKKSGWDREDGEKESKQPDLDDGMGSESD